jgi:hypothetical protein
MQPNAETRDHLGQQLNEIPPATIVAQGKFMKV